MCDVKKILFLHGFFASGQCTMAQALREAVADKATVITPDLPLNPKAAMEYIRTTIDAEHPDLLVGNSCGAFFAQMLAPIVGLPALLGNPHFEMPNFLRARIGAHTYKSPRSDGKQEFIIDEQLIADFEEICATQFSYCNPYYRERVWGLFGEQDTLAHYEAQFCEHYSRAFHFPGAHTPTAVEVKQYYAPLAEELLALYPRRNERFFRHFKGGHYKYIRTAFDSETTERMVIYQALYGEHNYWVRPEKMFFENITRNDEHFARFTEIDSAATNGSN